jgi:hypothetical protein
MYLGRIFFGGSQQNDSDEILVVSKESNSPMSLRSSHASRPASSRLSVREPSLVCFWPHGLEACGSRSEASRSV